MTAMRSSVLMAAALLMFANFGEPLDYSCDPLGVITVVNPDPKTYIHAVANTTDTDCVVTFGDNGSNIVITGCDKSSDITMILSDEPTVPTMFTKRLQFHAIKCEKIPPSGIIRSLLDDSQVTNVVSTSVAPTVTPRMKVKGGIEDKKTGASKPVAKMGEPVLWQVVGPEGYIIMPITCHAYSGKVVANAKFSIKIVEDGCSSDKTILSDFMHPSPQEKHIVFAYLYAFKFPNSNDVTMLCTMKGCPTGSTQCDFSCPDKRRKRSVLETIMRRSIEKSRDGHAYDVMSRDEPREAKVSVTLHVTGDPDPAFIERYFGFLVSGQKGTRADQLIAMAMVAVCMVSIQ